LIALRVHAKKAGLVPAFFLSGARVIVLFTDFGCCGPYLGQVKAVLHARAPRVPVLDALHNAPSFGIEPAAHLLAALAPFYPRGSVFLAVVDPGVGGPRDAIVAQVDGRSFVGPDNGLLSIIWQRARKRRCRRMTWRPAGLSTSFHGRDLFAPMAAAIALGRVPRNWLSATRSPTVLLDGGDLARVIYVDHYGNAMTGLRASGLQPSARLVAAGRRLGRVGTFGEAPAGSAFWYENSLGLVEIAANGRSAARKLGLRIGSRVTPTTR
jgi:S-adenosylmethionine hydrolase